MELKIRVRFYINRGLIILDWMKNSVYSTEHKTAKPITKYTERLHENHGVKVYH